MEHIIIAYNNKKYTIEEAERLIITIFGSNSTSVTNLDFINEIKKKSNFCATLLISIKSNIDAIISNVLEMDKSADMSHLVVLKNKIEIALRG